MEVLGRAQLMTPGLVTQLAPSSTLNRPINTCRIGLALGPGGHYATGAGPAQRSLRSGDVLHLRNTGKGPAATLHLAVSPAQPCPRRCTACVGAACPTAYLLCESLASIKYGGHCVPALVTQWFCEEQSVYVFLAQKLYSSV